MLIPKLNKIILHILIISNLPTKRLWNHVGKEAKHPLDVSIGTE